MLKEVCLHNAANCNSGIADLAKVTSAVSVSTNQVRQKKKFVEHFIVKRLSSYFPQEVKVKLHRAIHLVFREAGLVIRAS